MKGKKIIFVRVSSCLFDGKGGCGCRGRMQMVQIKVDKVYKIANYLCFLAGYESKPIVNVMGTDVLCKSVCHFDCLVLDVCILLN